MLISKGSFAYIKISAISLVTIILGYFLKISPIIGSAKAFFSVADFIMPLAGVFHYSGIVIAFLIRAIATKGALFSAVTFFCYIPSFFGALTIAYKNFLFRVAIPLLCMILFCMHPIGQQAIPYTFYWLIPIALYSFKRNSFFAIALSATFVTHAVGSVIWLYTKSLPSSVWLGLILVVFFERLLAACLMTGFYYAAQLLVMHARRFYKVLFCKKNYVKKEVHGA